MNNFELLQPYSSVFSVALIAFLLAYLGWMQSLGSAFLVGLYFGLASGALNSFNNITDVVGDRISRPQRVLPRGSISLRDAFRFMVLVYMAAILAGVSLTIFDPLPLVYAVIALDLVLTYSYSSRPPRLKKIAVVKNSIISAHSIVFPFLVAALLYRTAPFHVTISIPALFLVGVATFTIQDFEDLEGDQAMKEGSVPHLLGRNGTTIYVISLYLAAMLLILLYLPFSGPYTSLVPAAQACLSILILKGRTSLVYRANILLSLVLLVFQVGQPLLIPT